MRVIKLQLVFSMALCLFASVQIISYLYYDGTIDVFTYATVSGSQAQFYYYVMWALIVVGVILIATSFRRKRG